MKDDDGAVVGEVLVRERARVRRRVDAEVVGRTECGDRVDAGWHRRMRRPAVEEQHITRVLSGRRRRSE
jgi:hypothetical protein